MWSALANKDMHFLKFLLFFSCLWYWGLTPGPHTNVLPLSCIPSPTLANRMWMNQTGVPAKQKLEGSVWISTTSLVPPLSHKNDLDCAVCWPGSQNKRIHDRHVTRVRNKLHKEQLIFGGHLLLYWSRLIFMEERNFILLSIVDKYSGGECYLRFTLRTKKDFSGQKRQWE